MRHWILACAAVAVLTAFTEPSRADGTAVFNTYCAMCHQLTGLGVPGQFPRIAGRADEIARSPKGREYLCTLVIYGMMGRVKIDGTPLLGVMPPFGSLSDQDLAQALNHVMHLGGKVKVRPFTAAEVKAQRRPAPLSASEVFQVRTKLLGAGLIP